MRHDPRPLLASALLRSSSQAEAGGGGGGEYKKGEILFKAKKRGREVERANNFISVQNWCEIKAKKGKRRKTCWQEEGEEGELNWAKTHNSARALTIHITAWRRSRKERRRGRNPTRAGGHCCRRRGRCGRCWHCTWGRRPCGCARDGFLSRRIHGTFTENL